MPVSSEQVEKALNVDEPDYARAARLGPAALPHLEAIVREGGAGMAAKAVYLASLIPSPAADSVIDAGASRGDPVVRVAAAAALSGVSSPDRLADIAVRLLADPEHSVRRRVIRALPASADPSLARRLEDLADALPDGERKRHVVEALGKVRAGPERRAPRTPPPDGD
jgi:HEAT repeat protein